MTYLPRHDPLNWYRFDVKFSIELLDVFINNVEGLVKSSIQEYSDKKETLILDEQPEINYARIVDIHNGLDSDNYFGVVNLKKNTYIVK